MAKNFVTIGTPLTSNSTKVMLLGSGELGKEVAIELQRLGVEVIAVDRYANAPAMQVAHRSYVISMLDGDALERIIKKETPNFVVPEIEAIATSKLIELEKDGFKIIPTANAAFLTMNREGIRRLASEQLGLKTSKYKFASSKEEFLAAVTEIGLPCVVKPIMSSSGKGQSTIRAQGDIDKSWDYAQSGGRAGEGRVIVEGFVDFDYEITQLTVRHKDGVSFCDPIGHIQIKGDYRESWQPHPMTEKALRASRDIADKVTAALGGWGIFGVELFVKGDEVFFSEVSPRPHDTGLVTLVSQDLSEFGLHARAILGLPIPTIRSYGPSASCALLVSGRSELISYDNVAKALEAPDTHLRLFGKPNVDGERRMGVTLARAATIEEARQKATQAMNAISTTLG